MRQRAGCYSSLRPLSFHYPENIGYCSRFHPSCTKTTFNESVMESALLTNQNNNMGKMSTLWVWVHHILTNASLKQNLTICPHTDYLVKCVRFYVSSLRADALLLLGLNYSTFNDFFIYFQKCTGFWKSSWGKYCLLSEQVAGWSDKKDISFCTVTGEWGQML